MTPEAGWDIGDRVGSPGRIIYDGLDPTPDHAGGIVPYQRLLTRVARSLGYDVGVVYGPAFTPDTDPLLQEILFFDQLRASHQTDRKITLRGRLDRKLNRIIDQLRHNFTVTPLPLRLGGAVLDRQHADFLAEHDRAVVSRNLFASANTN